MLCKTTAILAAAILLAAAAPKTAPPKPADTAKAAAVAHLKPAPVQPDAAFDARNPSNLIEVFASLDARAEITRTEGDAVMLKVTSPAGAFEVQFAGCDAHARACSALQFDASAEQRTATLAEINRFNQSSLSCRLIQDKAGKPHVLYSALVSAREPRVDMLGEIDAWRGCIADFGAFLKDPAGYLASAP